MEINPNLGTNPNFRMNPNFGRSPKEINGKYETYANKSKRNTLERQKSDLFLIRFGSLSKFPQEVKNPLNQFDGKNKAYVIL